MHVQGAALAGTISNYRLRRALICRYFGDRVNMIEVASHCRVNRDTASDHNKRVVDYLAEQERVAEIEIAGRLEAAGVVGEI
jgi:hypothetical protein